MRIRISHEITHRFTPPARMLIQNLRVTPSGFDCQYVLGWRISLDIDASLRQSEDPHGNILSCFSHHGDPLEAVTVISRGEVQTTDAAGVVRGSTERLPPEMYLRESPAAYANGALRAFAKEAALGAEDGLDALHRLMDALHQAMTLEPGAVDSPETAAEAFALRRGHARDFAQVFIACARHLQIPARYVSGYRARGEQAEAGAHAWAEVFRSGLGWVGFDATANMCPDDAYVRGVVGFDAQDAAFARSAAGGVEDRIDTVIEVEQARFQSQG